MMIGQELAQPSQRAFAPGDTVLQINGLSLPGAGAFGVSLQDISFRLRAGEILGIAGWLAMGRMNSCWRYPANAVFRAT